MKKRRKKRRKKLFCHEDYLIDAGVLIVINYHWELSRKVDAGSTNTLIDQIFLSIEDLIDAKMVCGAGGGGFLQVIPKKGVQKADVHKRLKDVFQDNPVDVWDCEII